MYAYIINKHMTKVRVWSTLSCLLSVTDYTVDCSFYRLVPLMSQKFKCEHLNIKTIHLNTNLTS